MNACKKSFQLKNQLTLYLFCVNLTYVKSNLHTQAHDSNELALIYIAFGLIWLRG